MIPTTPIETPSVAQLIDGVLDRPEYRAERNDDRLRVLGAVAAEQPAGVTPERVPEVAGDLGDQLERLHLLGVRQVAHLRERLGPDHRADRDRIVGVEDLARSIRRQVRIDLRLRRASPRARPRA